MAAGRAVVASEVGGVPEALAAGGGVTAPPGDAAALAAQIERLVSDPTLARSMGLDGRRAVLARFGVERLVEETLALYQELGRQVRDGALSERGRTRTDSSRS